MPQTLSLFEEAPSVPAREELAPGAWVLRGFAEALLEWLLDQGEPLGVAFSG